MTVAPSERLKTAHAALDKWLAEFDLDNPIETALNDLCGEVEELVEWHKTPRYCHHQLAKFRQCPDCLTDTIKAMSETAERTWNLWEERA